LSQLPQGSGGQVLGFGTFRLLKQQKQLLDGATPVRLGSRAFDLLTALAERAGTVVSRKELEACVWPRTVVEETSLRAHISALRKALGEGQAGARYIANIPGRGYCFVAPVSSSDDDSAPNISSLPLPLPQAGHKLPFGRSRMVGRAQALDGLIGMLRERRFVSVVGAGGIGKTTMALALSEELRSVYPQGICFIDLSPVVDPKSLAASVAAALGISAASCNAFGALAAQLKTGNRLLILDNCEHVIEAAAVFAEQLLGVAPGVALLATSREPLSAEGEWVYRLEALELPPDAGPLSARQAMAFAAVQLFVQRATATSDSFVLTDANAPFLRDVCRGLDGLPLAIELAAARVDALGLEGLAARIGDHLSLLTRGRRTAVGRHRTLRALMDWSHELLSPAEQTVLQRLAVFKTSFTLDSAAAIAIDPGLDRHAVAEAVLNLAAKSLVSISSSSDGVRYRLLQTTRVYALEKLLQRDDSQTVFRHHARHLRTLLAAAENVWDSMSRSEWIAAHGYLIDDVRAALDWSFSHPEELAIAVELTAAAVLTIYEMGLLDEYHRRVELALENAHLLPADQQLLELRLNTALSFSSGQALASRLPNTSVYHRTLELAEQLAQTKYEIAAHYSSWVHAFGNGDYLSAVEIGERVSEAARQTQDLPAILLSDRLHAQAWHFMGDHAAAKTSARKVLDHIWLRLPLGYTSNVPRNVSMRILLARILWLEGFPDQASAMAGECLQHAEQANPNAVSQALGLAVCPIALWRGENAAARPLVARLLELGQRHSSYYWTRWAQSYDAVLDLRESGLGADACPPMPLMSNAKERDCMATMAAQFAHPESIARANAGAAGWCAPEIFRIEGERLLLSGQLQSAESIEAAQAKFRQSLQLARQQNVLSWQLRSACSLARLWASQGLTAQAYELVSETHGRFTEGFETADLREAGVLLDELGGARVLRRG
jgi:predicted ATPase/DNA-binding winged helix-turn-helix (wHTH) protein